MNRCLVCGDVIQDGEYCKPKFMPVRDKDPAKKRKRREKDMTEVGYFRGCWLIRAEAIETHDKGRRFPKMAG